MNINRHNYEELFLLYVDNELSAAERKAVDVFVQQNPDLQIELSLLQETVLKADDLVLDKKDWLYMEKGIGDLQQTLLLYTDNELNRSDKNAVEQLIATDKAALAEYNILQQARLQPDLSVVFDDKQSLYRKEPARIIPFKWWRVAAAAVLLGAGIWTGISIYSSQNSTTQGEGVTVRNNKKPAVQKENNTAPVNAIAAKQPGENAPAENIASTPTTVNDASQQALNNKPGIENSTVRSAVAVKENAVVQNSNIKKPDNNLPKPALQNINNSSSNEITAQNVSPMNNSNRVSGNNEVVVKTPAENKAIVEMLTPKTDPNITAIAVVNTNKAADAENNNRYLDVDDEKHKRSALGGLLRKAKRVLERTTNVKTGEGVKIAGFEIALK